MRVRSCGGKWGFFWCEIKKRGAAGGLRSAVCRLPSPRGGGAAVVVVVGGRWDVSGPVCGNPALLTSHTLFSRSYKPLMPQKMLGLLWAGTAEEGGHRGRRQAEGRRGLAGAWLWPPRLPSPPLPLPSGPLDISPPLLISFSSLRHSRLLSRGFGRGWIWVDGG